MKASLVVLSLLLVACQPVPVPVAQPTSMRSSAFTVGTATFPRAPGGPRRIDATQYEKAADRKALAIGLGVGLGVPVLVGTMVGATMLIMWGLTSALGAFAGAIQIR